MKKYLSKTLLIVCLSLILGCDLILIGFPNHKEHKFNFIRNYIIENGTNHKIELKFYDRQQQQYFIDDNILNTKGTVFTRSSGGESARVVSALGAFQGPDSLVIIFDDIRKGKIIVHDVIATTGLISTSTTLVGIDKNILLDEVYTVESKNSYRYVFTEQDYDNAIDCNGNCD